MEGTYWRVVVEGVIIRDPRINEALIPVDSCFDLEEMLKLLKVILERSGELISHPAERWCVFLSVELDAHAIERRLGNRLEELSTR
jgi:hypothetical protein